MGGNRLGKDGFDDSKKWAIDKTWDGIRFCRNVSVSRRNLDLNSGLLEVVRENRSLQFILRGGKTRIFTKSIKLVEMGDLEVVLVYDLADDAIRFGWGLLAAARMQPVHHSVNADVGKRPGRLPI